MRQNIEEYKNSLKNIYMNAVDIVEIRKNLYEIELPIFLNTGDAVDLQISIKNEEFIIKNELYKLIERQIEDKDLKKDYFLNEERFIALKEILSKDKIEINLLLEKRISKEIFEKNFIEEIFEYTFKVTRYYNYIYDYLVENLKGDQQSKVFKEEIKNFIEKFNKKKKSKKVVIEPIEDFENEIVSSYNLYYKTEDRVITGINSKVHLWEAINDIENIKKKYGNIKTYILIDQKKKNDLSAQYIDKIFSSENNIEPYQIKTSKDFENFEKILLGTKE